MTGQELQKAKLVPTEEQQAIIDAHQAGTHSIMGQAYAGCSKTSTLEMSAPKVKTAALAVAFNKSIAEEMSRRLPNNWLCKTMNGLGHQAWAKAQQSKGVTQLKLDDKKLGKLLTEEAKTRRMELDGDLWTQGRQLISGAMRAGIVPGDEGEYLTPDTRDNWEAVAEDLEINGDFDYLYELCHQTLKASIKLARQGIISYDDQVYCPTVLVGIWPKFPRVAVDEAQDLNLLNHRMVQQVLRSDGLLTVIGDDKQSIYAFRGSVNGSMEKMRGISASRWLDLPLHTTFRCPKVIVARQQEHAPGFKAYGTNAEGRFARFSSRETIEEGYQRLVVENDLEPVTLDNMRGWNWAKLQSDKPAPQASLAILCRNNGPLMQLAFKLIRRGVGVVMAGRDIGRGLQALSRKIIPVDNTPRDICAGKIEEWRERESSLARANGKDEKCAGIEDRAECLQAVLSHAGAQDAGSLRAILDQLFARTEGLARLSSVHRAKGLEWDTVLHLDPWRLPSKWARQSAARGDMRQLEQEKNLKYVCETRTKHTLIEANLEDFQ